MLPARRTVDTLKTIHIQKMKQEWGFEPKIGV